MLTNFKLRLTPLVAVSIYSTRAMATKRKGASKTEKDPKKLKTVGEVSEESNEKFTFFYGKDSPFSQFHNAKFTVNGVDYKWAEQYMMHQKAVLFKDKAMEAEILEASAPLACKKFGRKVKNFDKKIWGQNCVRIVEEGNYHKFTQNDELLKALVDTRGTSLAEASPLDRLWGIGVGKLNELAQSRSTWRGKNLLGDALTRVRDRIISEREGEEKTEESRKDEEPESS